MIFLYTPLGRGVSSGREKRMKKRWILFSLMMGVLSFLLAGCTGKVKSGNVEVPRPEITGVKTAKVQMLSTGDYYETAGIIKGKNTSMIASKVMGTVTSVKVKEGDRVEAGELLLTIDSQEVLARVEGAQAGYREAVKGVEQARQNRLLMDNTYERYRRLFQQGAISQQDMDRVENQKRVANLELERMEAGRSRAQAGLSEAQIIYAFTQITSPVRGIVTGKKVDEGSMAVPGVTLLVVEDTSSYQMEADVDERLNGKLSLGMKVEGTVDSAGRRVQGIITEIAPAIDPSSRKFHIKMSLEGEGLTSGQYVRVQFPGDRREMLIVPQGAIIEKGQLTGLYTVDASGVVAYRVVRLGKNYEQGVEVLSGLNPGDTILVEGVNRAVDGGLLKEVRP